MGGTDETLKRLAAFAEGVAWPDELGVSLHEFGPCFLGTTIHLDVFAEYEGDDEVLAEYPRLTPEQVALGRDYWERHGPLFEAACWLSYTENAAFPSPEGDQLATLQGDIRTLLAQSAALRDQFARAEAVAEAVRAYQSACHEVSHLAQHKDQYPLSTLASHSLGLARERMGHLRLDMFAALPDEPTPGAAGEVG